MSNLPPETGAPEHFVTCFDRRFLLQGLALHASLRQHCPGSFLWVLALDDAVAEHLTRLRPPHLAVLPLPAVETLPLRKARADRSWAEYIFTLTPFSFEFVFARDSSVRRVTYVDADLLFFRSPRPFFEELEVTGSGILVTPHGFPPALETLAVQFGRFCVQFLTVTREARSLRVIRSWQEQCRQSCSTAPAVRGRIYGDQKYLDDWPEQYPGVVHVASRLRDALGPWNVDSFTSTRGQPSPVFYHFHSFRVFHPRWIQLCSGYRPVKAGRLYATYLETLAQIDATLAEHGIARPVVPFAHDPWWGPRLAWRLATRRAAIRYWPGRLPDGARFLAAPESQPVSHLPP